MSDYMEIGSIVPLENGWYLETATNVKFRYDRAGNAVDERGNVLNVVDDYDDEDDYRE